MESCDKCNHKNSVYLTNPITQVAAMPYSLYLSLQGKYFLGSTKVLEFGNRKNAWAGLFNPYSSNVNLYVYSWQVSNTCESPVRAQIWFNSNPPGQSTIVNSVTPSNTALCPQPKPKTMLLQANNVTGEPTGGNKAFVRRALPDSTIGDEEYGKFIFPPGGSFIIFLSDPETPDEPASAAVTLTWWEEKIAY